MMKRVAIAVGVVAVMILIFIIGVFAVLPYTPNERAPVVAPQAIGVSRAPQMVVVNTASLTQTSNFSGVDWASAGYSLADVYYSIDQEATPNPITLTLQVSSDKATWLSHSASSAVLSNNQADTNGYVGAIVIHLQYFRIGVTAGGSAAVTPTLKVYLH